MLNALQYLVPKAQKDDFLPKTFDALMEHLVRVDTRTSVYGGEEPEIATLRAFVDKRAKRLLKVDFRRFPQGEDGVCEPPDLAMEAKFKEKEKGVFVFGFEGRDSHFTVARSVALATRVMLFDSWEYGWFER